MPYLLSKLGFVAIDCQATGPHPQKGDIVELGWAVQQPRWMHNDDPCVSVSNCLIRPDHPIELTRQFSRVTGISTDYLEDAVVPADAWRALHRSVRKIVSGQQFSSCLAVIHYARYEIPFLNDLHRRYGDDGCFPFRVVCTHEICRRAFPELPRRGLRAIAGFFGYSVPPLRRAALHATATVAIWRHLVAVLRDIHGVRTLRQLQRWLNTPPKPPCSQRIFPMPMQIRKKIPDRPGVYHMLRQDGSVLYIGKSRALKQRVNQYFQKKARHPEHILEMLTQATDIVTFPTRTALEAALFESDHIKHHSPPYNIALQRRDRMLCYASSDLCGISSGMDANHPIGPLPDHSVAVAITGIQQLTELWRHHKRFDCPYPPYMIMAIPDAYAPEADVFFQGIQLFFERNRDELNRRPIGRCLIKLGRRLWREKISLLKDENDQMEEPTQTSDESEPVTVWNADRVANAVESILMRHAHWMRRARWFGLISEATMVWEPEPAGTASHIGIVVHFGRILDRIDLPAGAPIPAPPGYALDHLVRRKGIDLTTYDRLRVLTTELRRLLAQGREIRVRLSPTRLLTNQDLHQILQIV